MPARKDFMRHIVNRVLASSKLPRQVVDDIRRAIGRAEDKYKFHAFGGDVRRLADYLRSRDFDDLIQLVKSVRTEKGEESAAEVLKRILLEAREAYKDIPEVVQAIDERLKELEAEETGKKSPLELLYDSLQELSKEGASVELDRERGVVRVTYGDRLRAEIGYDEAAKMYSLEYSLKGTESYDTVGDVKSRLRSLLAVARGRRE